MEIKRVNKGDSLTITFALSEGYNLERLNDFAAYLNNEKLPQNIEDNVITCTLSSETSQAFKNQNLPLVAVLDDKDFGVKSVDCGIIVFQSIAANYGSESTSAAVNIGINLTINQGVVLPDFILYDYLKGDSAYQVWEAENPGETLEEYFSWLRQPAKEAAGIALEAAEFCMSNVIALELHEDDMSLWAVTPDNYEGIDFEINEQGELIANY